VFTLNTGRDIMYLIGKTKERRMPKINETKPSRRIMYAAGILSDAQHLLGEECNFEDGWVEPRNAQAVIAYLNKAKELLFNLEEELENV